MPKERRDRSVSHDRSRVSPYQCSSSTRRRSSLKDPLELGDNAKDWDEARCPVCMEHPHNAVLLICSSHQQGCRPYMCDTSYRHSNCLDQFRKSFEAENSSAGPQQEETQNSTVQVSPTVTPESTVTVVQEELTAAGSSTSCENQTPQKLVCPLCRGHIKEWIILEEARHFMNTKSRSCSCETCDFSGTYMDLRKHARLEHPSARPSETDPERERNWRRLERQRDLGDLLSTLQSSMGDDRDDGILPIDDGGWQTVFFLIRVFRPWSASGSTGWSGTSRARAQVSIRRRSTRLWGETCDEETGSSSREEDNESSDDGSPPVRRSERIRRRTTPDNTL